MQTRKEKRVLYQNAQIAFGSSVDYPPFAKHRLHTHDRCEIYCVFRGSGYYITEGTRYPLEHGRIILMRPGEMHMLEPMGEEPRDSLSFHFDCSLVDSIDPKRQLLEPFFSRPLGMQNVYDHSIVATTEIYTLFRKMRELDQDNERNCLHASAMLLCVLSELKKLFDKKLYSTQKISSIPTSEIVDYVNHRLTEDLSPEQLCETFRLSRSHLDRVFKRDTGSPLCSYITLKRLLLAKGYIDDGMGAMRAATAAGFTDYSTFYRAYCKTFHCPPTGSPENPF